MYLLHLRTVVPLTANWPKRVPCCSLRVNSKGNSELGRTSPHVWALTSSFKGEETHRVTPSVHAEAGWLLEVPPSPTWDPWYWLGFPGHHSPFIRAPQRGLPCVNSVVIKHAGWESHSLFLWSFYHRTLPFIITVKLPFVIKQAIS